MLSGGSSGSSSCCRTCVTHVSIARACSENRNCLLAIAGRCKALVAEADGYVHGKMENSTLRWEQECRQEGLEESRTWKHRRARWQTCSEECGRVEIEQGDLLSRTS